MTDLEIIRDLKTLVGVSINRITHAGMQNSYQVENNNVVELSLNSFNLNPTISQALVLISKLPKLRTLKLTNCQIEKVDGIEKLRNLATLELNDNSIKRIEPISHLKKLVNLYLQENNIENLLPVRELKNLEILNISNNKKIKSLSALANLKKLKVIYAVNNSITTLIPIKNLEILNITDNKIKSLSGLTGLKKLKEIHAVGNKITTLAPIKNLTNLNHLNFSHNNVKSIGPISNLKKLKFLWFYSNQVTDISPLSTLKEISELGIGSNGIVNCESIKSLKKLKELQLIDNRITNLDFISTLKKIKILRATNNKISDINPIQNLKSLQTLDLDQNKIIDISPLVGLTNLERADLKKNLVAKFPNELLNLSIDTKADGYVGLLLGGNPLVSPPLDVLEKGKIAIQEYFDQRKRSGEELLNEAKLILLGDGRSGKTSLANRLLGKELPKEADRTQGVDIVIGEYCFKMANEKDFRINIWDFAGQDKYKTLHQLFYTDSSLYVMVAESGNTTTDFDDWFQTAELFGEGSPLMLVLNEFKQGIGMGSFDSNYWKKQFPELLKEVFTVNLGTNQNFYAAEGYIKLLAQTLPHTKYTIPSNWAAIRRVLNGRRDEQFITQKEYLKICEANNLPEREGALVLSSVLHKIGDCLHYQKSELLKQFIILKNEWATNGVYKILDDKVVAEEKCGFFDLSDLKRIWDGEEYKDMRPQLLELMKQFKLAYQLPGKDEFITPPLLPPARPSNFFWPEKDSLELYIEYEFLPKALLTQFIVTRHADIAEGRTLVWRHGVILKWDEEALGEVSKTKLQGRDAFHIRTQGSNRRGMMTVVLKTFRTLHADYKGIKCKEKVPCICKGCESGKNKQHYFEFLNLQFRLEKGRNEVECDNSLEKLNVLKLLENTLVFEKPEEGRALQLKESIVTGRSSAIRILKLFLASSNELKGERDKIEQALSRKNKSLRSEGFLTELMIWEDGKYIGTSLRSQDDYNLEIEQCNLFVMLFYSKVGKYTSEEFEKAKYLFDKGNKPRIRIFQKNKDLPKNHPKADADSRYEFLERLKNLEHFPILFENSDELINELEDNIDKLLRDETFVKDLKSE